MNLKTFRVIGSAAIALLLTAGCNESLQEKMEQAKRNAQDEQQMHERAQQDEPSDYVDEWPDFRAAARAQFAANDRTIDSLKRTIAASGHLLTSKAGLQVEPLAKRNDDLKMRVDAYRDQGKLNWDAFKRDCSKDIAGLGEALKDLRLDNQ